MTKQTLGPILSRLAMLMVISVLGCAKAPIKHERQMEPAPQPRPAKPAPGPRAKSPKRILSPAALALLSEAKVSETKGDLGKAAAIVERAIGLAPNDPLVWNRLAEIRLKQKKWPLAENLAKKSMQLSGSDEALKAKNREVIARSRQMLGMDSDETETNRTNDKRNASSPP